MKSLTLAASLSLAAATASAATLNINPFGDTFIRGGDSGPTTIQNFGAHPELLVGVVTNGGTGNINSARSLLSFNLSNPALTGATINSVTLTFVTSSNDTNSTDLVRTYGVYGTTQTFNTGTGPSTGGEVGVTWTSRDRTVANSSLNPWTTAGGSFNSTLLSSVSVNPDTIAGTTTVSFTTSSTFVSLVQTSIGGQLDLLLKDVSETSARGLLRFHSLNGTGTAPVLTIDYTPPSNVPEPSSAAALLGLAALGFVASRRRRA
jgi:hypothetical protein